MRTHPKWIVLTVSLVIMLALAAFAVPARGVVKVGQPGGFLSLQSGTFVDSAGQEYELLMLAGEGEEIPGAGNFTLQVLGPSISICSTQGGSVDIGSPLPDGNYSGNSPLTEIQCGTAFGQIVSIDGCTAKTEFHGYSHSDYPLTTYSGSNTVALTFRKKSASSGQITITVYTPKGPIKLSGTVSGPITMDTCS
jgi:hypothetical protein